MFKNPVAAVAPGQSVVFYQGLDCLGGAVIDKHRVLFEVQSKKHIAGGEVHQINLPS